MSILLAAVFLLLSVASAQAEDIVAACTQAFQIEQYRAQCIQNLSDRQAVASGQQVQRDVARQQALGMAAFGSGNALINGMNQGFRQMQVHPYVLPPAQNYQKR
jgi:hypothetical protein